LEGEFGPSHTPPWMKKHRLSPTNHDDNRGEGGGWALPMAAAANKNDSAMGK
jgi:hypothetical protein